jgi:hypothetical protein
MDENRDQPFIELPRPTPGMVEHYVRANVPNASDEEIASRVAEVIMTDALGRAIHHGRTPGGLLDLPKCSRVTRAGLTQEVPYGYEDKVYPGYSCQCEQISGGLIAIMKAMEVRDAMHNRLVIYPDNDGGQHGSSH